MARSFRGAAFAGVIGVAALAGCGPDPGSRVSIFIDTDAPVPGGAALGFPPSLFDRVKIEVFPAGQDAPCSECARVIALDHESLSHAGISFGLGVPGGLAGARIRATAYRSAGFPDGNPTSRGSLQVVVVLPAIESGDAGDLTVLLPTSETGAPETSLEHPREIAIGKPDGARVGTWKPAQRRDCTGTPWPGQVCVPGGAFFMPAVFASVDLTSAYDEQLVVLPPFYIDATETTVGALLRSHYPIDPDALLSWSGDEEGVELGAFFDWATFSGNVERLALPVTSMNADFARSFCQSSGQDLPSEAEIAYLIGGTRSTRFPWGDDAPSCDDAWIARVQFGVASAGTQSYQLECGGPVFEPFREVGTSGRDRVFLDGGTVEDIVGNGSELTRDRFTDADDPCWDDQGVLVDPWCDPDDDPGSALVERGGSISTTEAESATARNGVPPDAILVDGTFRCARSGDDTTPAPEIDDFVLGQGCTTDSDCGVSDGAKCVGPETQFTSGGVVGGYCSRECSHSTECGLGGNCDLGWCYLGCNAALPVIETLDDPLAANKCRGRSDLVCRPDLAAHAICAGACTSDAQCGDWFCDRVRGGCMPTEKQGAEDGEPCSVDNDCKGICETGATGKICASICSAGGELDSDDCGGPGQGICYAAFGSESPGSLGFCYRACASQSDCALPNAFCVVVPSDLEEGDLPPWWTVPTHVCDQGVACATVGHDCGDGATCTETPYGNYCLDPEIPW